MGVKQLGLTQIALSPLLPFVDFQGLFLAADEEVEDEVEDGEVEDEVEDEEVEDEVEDEEVEDEV